MGELLHHALEHVASSLLAEERLECVLEGILVVVDFEPVRRLLELVVDEENETTLPVDVPEVSLLKPNDALGDVLLLVVASKIQANQRWCDSNSHFFSPL